MAQFGPVDGNACRDGFSGLPATNQPAGEPSEPWCKWKPPRWPTYAPTVRLTGEVRAQVESDLSFRVGGRITERMVNVGDHVTADQVLARLDPQQQQATVTAADAAVQSAEAVLRQATSSYERQKALLAQGYTTKREHDQAQEAFRTAQAALDTARAQFGTARDHLSDTVLRAGAPGVITARNAEAGQVVQVAQTVFSIAQDGPRDAVFNVYESIFTRELGQSHHCADAGVRSGRDGQGHRA